MLIAIRSMIFALIKGIVWLGLGGVILWQVAIHSGPRNGTAYVHVPTPHVDITVDETKYHVETIWQTPIVCDLYPGTHVLRMFRNEQLLFEEEFSLDSGNEVVLTAWERPSDQAPAPTLPDDSLATAQSPSSSPRRPTRP
jgi:hypothetical protein